MDMIEPSDDSNADIEEVHVRLADTLLAHLKNTTLQLRHQGNTDDKGQLTCTRILIGKDDILYASVEINIPPISAVVFCDARNKPKGQLALHYVQTNSSFDENIVFKEFIQSLQLEFEKYQKFENAARNATPIVTPRGAPATPRPH